ncbi:MAG: TolC family protein [Gammaproteobacteria bacterium]|nr:TolC family protein [Gammaproteobacteria bacterium]
MNNPVISQLFAYWLSLLTGIVCVYSPGYAQEQIRLDINQAVQLALIQNLDVESAYYQRLFDTMDLQDAKDAFSAKYSFSSSLDFSSSYDSSQLAHSPSYTYSNSAGVSWVLPTGGSVSISLNHDGYKEQHETKAFSDHVSINLYQPLLKGSGKTIGTASLVNAKISETLSLLSLEDTLSDKIIEVAKHYRSYLNSQRELTNNKLSLERSLKQQEVTLELIRSGRLAKLEQVQSETDIAIQRLNVRGSEIALEETKMDFLFLLNIDSETDIITHGDHSIKQFTRTIEDMMALAFLHRNDWKRAKISLTGAELALKIAQDSQRWEFDLSTGYNLAGSVSDDDAQIPLSNLSTMNQGGYYVGLSLNIPLEKRESQRAVLEAKIGLQQVRDQITELEQRIILGINSAHYNMQVLWHHLELSYRAIELSKTQLELEQDKLKSGHSTSFQIMSFQRDLLDAENNLIESQDSYLNALLDIDQTLGITLIQWGIDVTIIPNRYLDIQ